MFIINFYLNMFRASFCPSSGEQRTRYCIWRIVLVLLDVAPQLLTSVSTCFGHHYVHLQENKEPVTAFGILFWFCWMWLVAVVGHHNY